MNERQLDVDVLVIGAGPAGLSAACHIGDNSRSSVLLIDAGRPFTRRPCPVDRQHRCRGCGGICNVISGFGGSIHYGDGVKLSRFPSGRRLFELLGDGADLLEAEALRLLDATAPGDFCTVNRDGVRPMPFALKDYPVAVLSSTQVRDLVEKLHARVTGLPNVQLLLGTEARHMVRHAGGFTVTVAPTRRAGPPQLVSARRVVVAVGRRGQRWWRSQVRQLDLDYRVPTPSVGLRFECPTTMLALAAQVHPDFKTTVVHDGVKVKTFCFCVGSGGGRIKFTDYGDHTLLDGHVVPEPGGTVANFALLAQLRDSTGQPRTYEWVERDFATALRELHEGAGLSFDHCGELFDQRTLDTLLTATDRCLTRLPAIQQMACYQANCLLSVFRKGDIAFKFLADPKICVTGDTRYLAELERRAEEFFRRFPMRRVQRLKGRLALPAGSPQSRLLEAMNARFADERWLDTPVGICLHRWFGTVADDPPIQRTGAAKVEQAPSACCPLPDRPADTDAGAVLRHQCLGCRLHTTTRGDDLP